MKSLCIHPFLCGGDDPVPNKFLNDSRITLQSGHIVQWMRRCGNNQFEAHNHNRILNNKATINCNLISFINFSADKLNDFLLFPGQLLQCVEEFRRLPLSRRITATADDGTTYYGYGLNSTELSWAGPIHCQIINSRATTRSGRERMEKEKRQTGLWVRFNWASTLVVKARPVKFIY